MICKMHICVMIFFCTLRFSTIKIFGWASGPKMSHWINPSWHYWDVMSDYVHRFILVLILKVKTSRIADLF